MELEAQMEGMMETMLGVWLVFLMAKLLVIVMDGMMVLRYALFLLVSELEFVKVGMLDALF